VTQDVPWRATDTGVVVAVRVTPRGGRDQIDGIITLADGRTALKVRVRAVPEDGAANEATEKLIARAAGVAPHAVRVIAGLTARLKQVAIAGDASALIERLRAASV
jgi:uncharacterized protein YggU (UPF0235/DUF167 family)